MVDCSYSRVTFVKHHLSLTSHFDGCLRGRWQKRCGSGAVFSNRLCVAVRTMAWSLMHMYFLPVFFFRMVPPSRGLTHTQLKLTPPRKWYICIVNLKKICIFIPIFRIGLAGWTKKTQQRNKFKHHWITSAGVMSAFNIASHAHASYDHTQGWIQH